MNPMCPAGSAVFAWPRRHRAVAPGASRTGSPAVNQVWRMGANEATEIEFYRDVQIGGKKITKGKYTLYAIATPVEWTMILNKETDTWGAFKYDQKKDVARVKVPVHQNGDNVDAFTMAFEKATSGINLNIAWDTVTVSLPISLK